MKQSDAETYHTPLPEDGWSWRTGVAMLPALAIAALPKCPLCLMAVLSIFGLGSIVKASWLLPLMLFFLGLALAALALRARRRRGYGPLLLGIGGALFILSGKFYLNHDSMIYAGAFFLISASVWSTLPTKDSSGCHC
jgi:hypothetical protein